MLQYTKATANFPTRDPGTIKQCYNCGTMSTPLWRRDAATQRILCNPCGLYQAQRNEPRPQALINADKEEDEQPIVGGNGRQCSHCGTHKTSVWRRNKDGEQVCNACGVYYRVNGRERPLTMNASKVKPRAKHSIKHSIKYSGTETSGDVKMHRGISSPSVSDLGNAGAQLSTILDATQLRCLSQSDQK
jgi:uncharacterized Zn finger protein (UPF0148 family)